MKGLFDDQLEVSPECNSLASELIDALHITKMTDSKLSQSNMSEVLDSRSKKHGLITVQDVINQYIQQLHQNTKYAIKVKSTKQLAKKFPILLKKYTDPKLTTPKFNLPKELDVELTNKAKIVSQRLGTLIWPENEKGQELLYIKTCLYDYLQFRHALNNLETELEISKSNRMLHLVRYLNTKERTISHFVENWVREIHKLAWNWEKWPGDLFRFRPTLQNTHFEKTVRSWLSEYTIDTDVWYEVKSRLNRFIK